MSDYQQRMKAVIDGLGTWYEDPVLKKRGEMRGDLYPYTKMFSPIQVNGVRIKNRLVMGPMGNISMAEESGRPNSKMIQYFTERAKGGVGLITSGLVPISHGIDPSVTEPGGLSYFPRIDGSRSRFAPWRDIAERCHGYGTRFFIQLTPGLGRVGSPECLLTKHKLPVSASWNPNFYLPAVPCRPLTGHQAKRIISNAGQAAIDAKVALIDGVYLHGHEGYLLEQMTNPAFNRRKLGRYADWKRFGLDLVAEIRKRVGPSYPIMYRIDLSLALHETYGERMKSVRSLKKFRNERTVDMTLEYMKELVAAGVDMFDVDLGCYDNWWLPHPPGPMPPGCFLEIARITKEYFAEHHILSNAGLEVPVVAVGKLGYPDLAEEALRDGSCDMIMLARPLLADPEWPKKAFAGNVGAIRPCIGDQEGCINEFVEGGHPQCAVNPRTGFEDLYDGNELAVAAESKRIAVVGAGPAGVMTALVAARRGHRVTLFEREREIGGMLRPGSRPGIKYDILNYRRYLEQRLREAVDTYELAVELGVSVDAARLKDGGFDVIVCATGTRQQRPPVEGINAGHVVFAVDVLNHPELAESAERIVVVGGGDVGCETAYFLSQEYGKQVTVVEMLPEFMKGSCTANRGWLLHHLEKQGVTLLNCTTLLQVGTDDVIVRQNLSKTVPEPWNTWNPLLPENIDNPLAVRLREQYEERRLDADLVVLAAGAASEDSLYLSCVEQHAAKEIHVVGDAFSPGRVFEAVKASYQIAITL